MNTLIVYDSQFGNTEQIAQKLADVLGTFGQTRLVQASAMHPGEFQGLDMLIVGCPTQAWNATPAMRAFLKDLASEQRGSLAVACFDTRFRMPGWITGSAAGVLRKTFKTMGIQLIVPPESFFVKGREGPLHSGELDRAEIWARRLAKAIEASQPAMR